MSHASCFEANPNRIRSASLEDDAKTRIGVRIYVLQFGLVVNCIVIVDGVVDDGDEDVRMLPKVPISTNQNVPGERAWW